jgi:hypothetical protein
MNKLKHLVATLAALFIAMQSNALTVDAGDYTRLPAGTNLALIYLQHTSGSEMYAGGDETLSNADLEASVGILRGARFMDVGNLTIAPQFLLPFGKLDTGGDIAALESTNGVGDLLIGPTIHLMQDPERKKAFAFTPWLYLPTGSYDADNAINALGENRFKFALQLGYITPLSEKWILDLVGDVTFFGENDEFSPARLNMEQDPLFELQSHIRYTLTAKTTLSAMLSHSWGGETEVEGVEQGNEQSRTKALFTLGHFLEPTIQILGSVGRDLSVDEGVAEDYRFNFRLLKLF